MTHPTPALWRFPWDREEAKAFHRALSQFVQHPHEIELMYRQAGGTRPLTAQPAHLAWQEAIDNLTIQDRLGDFCRGILTSDRLTSMHKAVHGVMDLLAEGERCVTAGGLVTRTAARLGEPNDFTQFLAWAFQPPEVRRIVSEAGGHPEQIPAYYSPDRVSGPTLWYGVAEYFFRLQPDGFQRFVRVVINEIPGRAVEIEQLARLFLENWLQHLQFDLRVDYGGDTTSPVSVLTLRDENDQEFLVSLAAASQLEDYDIDAGANGFAPEWKRIHRIVQDLYLLFAEFHARMIAIMAAVGYREGNALEAELETAQACLQQVARSQECARLSELRTLPATVSQVALVVSLAHFGTYFNHLVRALGVLPSTQQLKPAYEMSCNLSAALLNSLRMADLVLERHFGPPGYCLVES